MIEKKQKILIVDDSEMNRSILSDILGDEYEILEARDGMEAVNCLRSYSVELSLVLLDIVMPKMDGLQVLTIMNSYKWIQEIPVIMISAESGSEYIGRAYNLGATDYIQRPFDVTVVQRRVSNAIMLYAKQKKLAGLVEDQIYEKQKELSLMSNILNHIVAVSTGESDSHILHVRKLTEILLHGLLKLTNNYPLTPQDVSLITTASVLHDIGKIAIDGAIVNKKEKLTREEAEALKRHTVYGAEMLEKVPFNRNEPLLRVAKDICRFHHERYDGNGYPDGVKGDEIPISAQVVALAEAYDELTGGEDGSISHYAAIEKIVKGECGAFNPLLIKTLQYSDGQIRTDLYMHLDDDGRREIERYTREAVSRSGFAQRTLVLLDREREKYRFIASMSDKLLFEYFSDPAMITFLDGAAERLGVDATVTDPLNDEKMKACFGKQNLSALAEAISAATVEKPAVQYECTIKCKSKSSRARITVKVQFTYSEEEDKNEGESAIGIIELLS